MNTVKTPTRTPRTRQSAAQESQTVNTPAHTPAMTADQFRAALAEYADTKRKLEFAEVKYQHRIAIVNTRHKEAVAADTARLNALEQQIRSYAQAHRAELTEGKGKTAKVGASCLKWKTKPASVQIDDTETAIVALEKRGLFNCVRTKKEVNKAVVMAMRGELEADPIQGIAFQDGGESLTIEA